MPVNLCVRVPDPLPLDEAAFATVGAIALQGVRQAGAQVGEIVCVIGLGLMGLLAAQILKACGCRVIAVDLSSHRLAVAEQLGADRALLPEQLDVAREVLAFTGGKGVDVVLLAAQSSSNEPVRLAGEIARDRGRIVVLGAFPMDLPRQPFYEKELELRLSRSYGPGRYDELYERHGIDYPYGYVRWTEKRNMEAFLDLLVSGQVRVGPLITHRKPLREAPEAYRLLRSPTEPLVAVLFQYEGAAATVTAPPRPVRQEPARNDRVHAGLIGAGNFAQAYRLPFLRRYAASLEGLATRHGHHAAYLQKKYGFAFASTDPLEVISSPAVSTVFVATRHDTHASLAQACLLRHKHLLLEKPLALNEADLRAVYAAFRRSEAKFLVAYNRRFAPAALRAREHLAGAKSMLIQYRVNNAWLPPGHWLNDPIQGGGRLLGECCHFLDFLCFLADAAPVSVTAQAREGCAEDVVITVQLADGSVGSIFHAVQGDPGVGKERIEVYAGAHLVIIEDFSSIRQASGGKARSMHTSGKGHAECVRSFCQYVEGKIATPPIPPDQQFLGALATLRLPTAIATGRRIPISWADLEGEHNPGTG